MASGSIVDFCKLSAQQRLGLGILPAEKMNDVEALVRVLPHVVCTAKCFTENQEEMFASDFITWQFKVQYPSLSEKEFPGYVHSKAFPFLKKQAWYVMVTDESKQRIIFVQKIMLRATKNEEGRIANIEEIQKEPLNEAIFELRQRLGRPGQYRFLVTFMNDSYMGFDQSILMEFTVKPDDPAAQNLVEYSEEDHAAVKGPGMLQTMLNNEEDESSEEDQDLDEVERLQARLKKAGMEEAMQRRKYNEESQLAR